MEILHAGIFRDHDLGNDIIFEKGLTMNGHTVERFDYRTILTRIGQHAMYRALVDRAKNKDLVFIGKGQELSPGVLSEVREEGVKIALWYGDMRPRPEPWLLANLCHVDYFFMSSGGETLKRYFVEGKPRVAAYFFTPSDPDLPEKYASIPRGNKDLVITASPHLFASKERVETVKYLRNRRDVQWFGGVDWLPHMTGSSLTSRALRRLMARRKWVRGPEYVKAIKSAKIGIGVSAYQHIPKYTSARLTHFLTFGTFYLPWRFPQLNQLFREGKEIVSFEGISDLDMKIRYYLEHADEREEISKNGQRRILTEYNTKRITAMMLDVIRCGYSDKFEWVEVLKQ
jgi:hypothetical protein